MSSSKNTHLVNGWEAFSYFCCSAWNDTYLIDISKAVLAGDLHTQKAQFVPVTQIYTTIDNLMSQKKLYSVFEYPMAPDHKSSTQVYGNGLDLDKNLSTSDAASVRLNTIVSSDAYNRLDNSNNVIGQGIKCKSKMYDCIKVALDADAVEYSLAVTPTRIPYFGQNQGNIVANTKPQRVLYIVSAELERITDPSNTQMKIVSDPYQLIDKTTVLINADIDMEEGHGGSVLKSSEFGDVTVSYSYNWDVHGSDDDYTTTSTFTTNNRQPLTQSGNIGSKYMVISCIPTYATRDKRENVHSLKEEFYGVSPTTDDGTLSFGYVSYQALGGKTATEDDIKANNSRLGYTFPRSALTANKNASIFKNNWFEEWVTAYGDLAGAMQGISSGGSDNFASKFSKNNKDLAYSKLVNQTAVVNTNFLKKLLYIKKNSYLDDGAGDKIKVYITVVEDWVSPANALDSFGSAGIVNGAAYIPYLDVNASRQIVAPDYDIWSNGETSNPAGDTIAAGTNNYTVTGISNHNTMVPHQGLNEITDFPKWEQHNLHSDSTYELNKDMLLFDWRAKTLAQPTFACCDLDKIMELGEESKSVRIDSFAASYISNEFTYKWNNADYILDANAENIYKEQQGDPNTFDESYVADKGTYVHAYKEIFNDQFSAVAKEEKIFVKFDPNKQIFKNDEVIGREEATTIINARYTKIPWFTWEGLSVPAGAQSEAAPGDIRCILTKEAVTALVSIIRTASLLITGMVMNHELNFKKGTVIDTITNKTLYTAWYNTKEFLRQLNDLPLSNTLNPEITSDFSTGTIAMPSWLEILKEASNVKIAQFFRSVLCNSTQLAQLIGPIDKLTTSQASLNYPPAKEWRKDGNTTVVDIRGATTAQKSYSDIVNMGISTTLDYYDVSFNSRNQVEYPAQVGSTYAEDMYSFNSTGPAVANTLLRGLVRPIIWDPSGTYPHHALIPADRRGKKLGLIWEKLAYISSEGTLRNNGNCLQKVALNYGSSEGDGSNQDSDRTARLMYCTPYVPVGQMRINNPDASYNSTDYHDAKDLYQHQDVSGSELFVSNAQTKAYGLVYGTNTHLDNSGSTLYRVHAATDASNCGPPLTANSATKQTRKVFGAIPKGIGVNDGINNITGAVVDADEVKIDLARGRRRLSLHTITSGHSGAALYSRNNNMGIGPLTWSCLHSKLVETGDGYFKGSLENTDTNKDFYVTDSLYRTQSVISLLLSGYGLYSDKVYDDTTKRHTKLYGSVNINSTSNRAAHTASTTAKDISLNELYEFSDADGGRKRFLSGLNKNQTCSNVDLLNLRLNNGDEITPKNSFESSYRWIGPSSHFLSEPNTEDVWRYIDGDTPGVPGNDRSSVVGRNQYSIRNESFASGGSGLIGSAKTYLHNGIADGTDDSSTDTNYHSAIGSAYEKDDFNENRPSLFAIARGYDISRNLETELLLCNSLTSNKINCNFTLSENASKELTYVDGDGAALVGNTKTLVEGKKVEIERFTAAMKKVVDNLCLIVPASDKAPLHLTDHHFTTLAADDALSSATNKAPNYNNSQYLRLQGDMMEYINDEMSLLDLTGLDDAQSERRQGGALVEGMYYIDDLSSSTIRIFYPTPLRDEFVRPDKANAMVALAGYVADTCKGATANANITGIGDGTDTEISLTFADGSFNSILDVVNKDPSGTLQNFIFGRGGIITKKRQAILELIDNLPGWSNGAQPLEDTSGGKLLKKFIENPYTNSTGGNTDNGNHTDADNLCVHFKGSRQFAKNPDLLKDLLVGGTSRETDAVRYRNMSVLTITGVRDFAFLRDGESHSSAFAHSESIEIRGGGGGSTYKKKRVLSRIGSIIFPGTNKKTKYVIANHEQDRAALSKSILSNLAMGNSDDSESKNYAIRGHPFKLKVDASMNSYYLEATKVPGFIASHWNKVQACICAPSMSSSEIDIWEPEVHPGQKFRANFGVVVKQRTSGIAGANIGLSAVSALDPLEYTVKLYTIKSPADTAAENTTPTMAVSDLYNSTFDTTVKDNFEVNLMLRSVEFDETEIMNYYKLNTIIFLDEGSSTSGNYKQVDKFITNMPENLTQYLGYMNRTVTAFMQDYPAHGDQGKMRYWMDTKGSAKTNQDYAPGMKNSDGTSLDVSFNAQYDANQLYFENNLISIKSMQDDFDKQLMAWNEGIVGAKIGDMKLEDFDNISAEQVVDTSETLTEIPGFHIMMWVEKRLKDSNGNTTEKIVISPDSLDSEKNYQLSSGKDGLYRGLYDDIQFSLYESDLLVKRGALTIQNEQLINNRNPVVQALASRGSITPSKKYEYGVYKENMWLSMYKNGLSTQINVPVINELSVVTHPDSIGLNTSHCEAHPIKKSMGILVFQHANVLYENHGGINFSIPSSLKNINTALSSEHKLDKNQDLVFCMCAVPENNNQIAQKTGVNPANSALLNIIANDTDINDTSANQWGLCFEEIIISSKDNAGAFTSEFENVVSAKDVDGNDITKKVDRDIQFNMMIDLFRSKNTTKVRPVITFNKLPRIEQIKRALEINCLPHTENSQSPNFPSKNYAPFLGNGNGFNYSKNFACISRLKYHVDASATLLTGAMSGGAGYYTGAAAGDPASSTDRETLMDLFFTKNNISADASGNMFTITKLEAARKLLPAEMNGANAYTGGDYNQTNLQIPFYANTFAKQNDISGNILHHYRKISSKKTGMSGLWIETLIYFTSLLTRPLLDGEDSLSNVFWKIRDTQAGEWINKPPELTDVNKDYEEELRSYRKCLVSTLIHSMPATRGSFCTEILNRRPPAAWKETGKVYNAFPQLEFCATFRNQLIDKSYLNSETSERQLIKKLAKFPIYCYLDDNNQNIVFPSWKEEGITIDGERKMVYEEKINYTFATDYYGDEFINDLLDPVIGFGFNYATPFRRVKELQARLEAANKTYINNQLDKITTGAKSVLENIFGATGKLEAYKENTPRTLGGDNGYLKKLGILQMWTPLFEVLYELKTKKSDNTPSANAMSTYIQPDIIIGSHVNTFKNKFDIQNFQLKLNTVRLDINLLKECTAFEIKEIEFSDNTLLTLDTLNPVGNAQSLFLPIMIKTKAEKVETVKSRKVELKTDYLLETLNKMDVMSLMNNIWYRIDEKGNRIVLSPTEVARVPLFRNHPGIILSNSYEPILKHELSKQTTVDQMILESLRHVDGGAVRGVDPAHTSLKDDRTWSGMGWCLKGLGQRLGFTGGLLDISGRAQQTQVDTTDSVTSVGKVDSTSKSTYESWFIEEFGLLANKDKGYDASGSVLGIGGGTNCQGAMASGIYGAHRQHLHPTQNTGGFCRSAWLAERLSTIVFGKQDFPSFDNSTEHSGNIPFNNKMGSGTGGVVTATWPKSHYKRSKARMTIIADDNFGRLKLAKVRQDDSARGQLRDYRYPGKKFDIDYNVPIFAESVPNTNGTFACQIIRMIKSGLVGRPEDDKILIRDQDVVDQINGGVYMAFSKVGSVETSNVHPSLYKHIPDAFTTTAGALSSSAGTTVTTNSPFDNVVMNPAGFMYLKLQEKKSVDTSNPYQGGFVPMQYVLQQLLSNDPQRFVLNEKEAGRHSVFTQKGDKDFNKAYKQWRVTTMDSGKPTNPQLLDAEQIKVTDAGWAITPVDSKPIALQVLEPKGRATNYTDPAVAQKDEPESAHPLALCIRGLDLDHCVMTYKDLSNNTYTAAAVDASGEFLKGNASDTLIEGINKFGDTVNNDAAADGHIRVGYNVNEKIIAKYGPALHLTEGNAPMQQSGIKLGRHKGLKYNGTNHDSASYWGNKPDLMKSSTDISGIAVWNSYIRYTDLTKTYPIYMLPLMDTDTLSIIVTNEGSLKDPLEISEGAEDNFDQVLKDITDEIKGWSVANPSPKDDLNINNTTGTGNIVGLLDTDPDGLLPETIEQTSLEDYPAITGHGKSSDAVPSKSKKKGLYFDCVNLLVAPELGPYEKSQINAWRHNVFGSSATARTKGPDGSSDAVEGDDNFGQGTVLMTDASTNAVIKHGSNIDISTNLQLTTLNDIVKPVGGWGATNSLEAYYIYLGMTNIVNPGGTAGSKTFELSNGTKRASYLAVDLSKSSIDAYYQKFVTRSFTIKYKLDDTDNKHKDYNDIRISQLSSDQVSAFEVKDDLSLPKKDIFDEDSNLRYEYENYKYFWDEATTKTDAQKAQNDIDQMMAAKPLLLSSMFTEYSDAQGSILIPRRFDGRPMDANIASQNIICIRKDNMTVVNKVTGKEIKSPTQEQIATSGDSEGPMKFSLDIGLPMQGGGLIRCKIPLEAAGTNSHAFFLDAEYNRDYLVFKVRDWVGNAITGGGTHTTIKKQNIIAHLHDALQRSQVAQLNERLLEPYTSAIATKYQPPPNTAYQMPVLLPSKPGGANIMVDGNPQPRTFFQPLNLIFNPVAGGEDHFELKPINESYYIRISANNTNWTNYMQQAFKSIPRVESVITYSAATYPNLPLGSVIKSGTARGRVIKSNTANFTHTVLDTSATSVFTTGGSTAAYYVPMAFADISAAVVPNSATAAVAKDISDSCVATYSSLASLTAATNSAYTSATNVGVTTTASHPQFGEMNGINGATDLSAVIHDIRQSQLTGTVADASNIVWDSNPQRATIYSLDLLALLNTTLANGTITHRLAPTTSTTVEAKDVVNDYANTTAISDFTLPEANKSIREKPILVLSDIGKTWVDYEGQMMGRDRFFRLCEVLGDPDDNYALAMDDLGDTDKYHGDLDIDGKTKGFYGKYFLDASKNCPWDLSGQPHKDDPEGSTKGTNANYLDIENKIERLNNPLQHLHYGSYTTLDDPTTGAGCVGFPNAASLKDSDGKFVGGNHRKQFRLAHAVPADGKYAEMRTIKINPQGEYDKDEDDKTYLFFPHWATQQGKGAADASGQYHSKAGFHSTASIIPMDASRVVHPSKYVFQPDLGQTGTGAPAGIWRGGNPNRATANSTTLKGEGMDEYTMEYIAYKYEPPRRTTAMKDERVDKTIKSIDASGVVKTGTLESCLKDDTCLTWEDIYGETPFRMGDGYVDNSRYRWAGSKHYTHSKYSEILTNKVPSLKDTTVLTAPTFKLHTAQKTPLRGVEDSGGDPMRAYMHSDNQERYYQAIEFFSTRKKTEATNKGERDESRQALSEIKSFKSQIIQRLV